MDRGVRLNTYDQLYLDAISPDPSQCTQENKIDMYVVSSLQTRKFPFRTRRLFAGTRHSLTVLVIGAYDALVNLTLDMRVLRL